jgi:hypothetical protein
MKTMQEEWRQYRDMVYPGAIPATQNLECHQAFFAGALCCLQAMLAAKGDQAAQAKLTREIWEINRHRLHTLKARN